MMSGMLIRPLRDITVTPEAELQWNAATLCELPGVTIEGYPVIERSLVVQIGIMALGTPRHTEM